MHPVTFCVLERLWSSDLKSRVAFSLCQSSTQEQMSEEMEIYNVFVAI